MLMPSKGIATLGALQKGSMTITGEFQRGFNYTFFVNVNHNGNCFPAVYKPHKGEQPLWDFPANSLAHREVAAYLISEALGWQLIPPTVYREQAPIGPGSLQLFIDHNPAYHYFNISEEDRRRLPKVTIFDLIINNADRKGSHIIFGPENHLYLIDHGLCFHVEDKLRTVIWDFAGEMVPQEITDDLRKLQEDLIPDSTLTKKLRDHITNKEINAIITRTDKLFKSDHFPHPPSNRRSYPYPPL